MEEPAAASAALLESSGHAAVTLPELSRSRSTLDEYSDTPTPVITKRKSLRMRPAEALQQQNAAFTAPLRPTTPQRPELRGRSSKMSLFNLFSKPKVEKQRGYAESGLDSSPAAPRSMSLTNPEPLKSDIVVRVQNADAEKGRPRPASSKSYGPKKSRLYTSKEPLPPIPSESRSRQWDSPPLFQVWPQTIKSATLEVSTSSSDVSTQRPKNRITGALLAPSSETLSNTAGYRGSGDSRTILPSRNGSTAGTTLPKKAIVLTTSGHLLQYAETGPSDRRPEKILQLGKDSAAFASDLIPGKHHVLQVSQAVDSSGISVLGSQSLLSRLSLRRLPASRMTSTFLLVMSGPDELNEWMSAAKKSIEVHGGKRARSDSAASRPRSRHPQPQSDVTRTPSVSHRLQIKRDPGGPSPLISPRLDASLSPPPPPPPVLHLGTAGKEVPDPPGTTGAGEGKAEVPEADNGSIKIRPRASSDCPSISSSTALSVEQQQLEKLRNSIRMSHTSTVATSVTVASRANSVTSSPSDPSKETADGVPEMPLTKSPHRTMSSFTLAKRRSGVSLSLKELPEGVNPVTLAQQQRVAPADGVVDSPVLGSNLPLPEPFPPLGHGRLSCARSTPDLKAMTAITAKRDSKLPSPHTEDRPASFIADLPDPTLWASKPSPSHRMSSSIPFPPLLETSTVKGHHRTGSGTTQASPTSRPLRTGSNSFSLPRSTPLESSPLQSQQRSPSDAQEEKVLSPVPAVHTLTAKVDVLTRTKIDVSYIPARKSSTSGSPPTIRSAKRTPPSRLSLFPSAQCAPPPVFPQTDILRRSPSASALSSHIHPQTHTSSANPKRLTRPASLQVRANYAPFVSAIKSQNDTVDPRSFATTAPIRSLKPSRSIATMQTTTASSPHPPGVSFALRSVHPETIDEATPLPSRVASPTPPTHIPRPSSRTRKSPRVSTQSIDISSLGPPAPPPSAPLPEIPTGDGNSERRGSQDRLSFIRSGTPIGIAIGEALEKKLEIPLRRGSAKKSTGLGVAAVEEETTGA